MSLREYQSKRDFRKTAEPAGGDSGEPGARYVIQKHAASRLHYDFRLELEGVLKSWAVPKGPSLDPARRVLAVQVEDHPIEYGSFEGTIPAGEYGGGTVMLWDRGTWEPEGDPVASYRGGKLVFRLDGERLKGRWALVRMSGKAGEDGKNWLLKKLDDVEARSIGAYDVLQEMTTSVASGRTMDEIAGGAETPATPTGKTGRRPRQRSGGAPDRLVRQSRRAGTVIDPKSIKGALRTEMPASIAPQLATLVHQVPEGKEWLFELKLDGYRMIAYVRSGKVSLITRRGNDWTQRFSTIAAALEELALGDAILDGEIVVLDPSGVANFQALQNQLNRGSENRLCYFVFDLIYYGGFDLRRVRLIDRKRLLARLLQRRALSHVIRYCDHISGPGDRILAIACAERAEGIIAKRVDSLYGGRRSLDWVKVKCLKRQEFVIVGWTEPAGSRKSLGALLLAYYRDGSDLTYCGRVGTGFTSQSLRELRRRLSELARPRPPFPHRQIGSSSDEVHWVEPQLIAEVEFSEWTSDGLLRHASFKGLREDKSLREVTRELPVDVPTRSRNQPASVARSREQSMTSARTNSHARAGGTQAIFFANVRLTHPGRVLFPAEGITKRDFAEYYSAVAPFILPHLVGRPLALVRCPDGISEPCFFQKHRGDTMPAAVRSIEIDEKDQTAFAIAIDDVAGLVSLVQMGVLEIHPWGSRADLLDRPDRLIIDIDPAEDLAWHDVVQAALHVKERLWDLGLQSFVRTTGGKGAHVVAPIARRVSWPELKSFARGFAEALVRAEPSRFLAQASKARRPGKIFLDYLRNERGATAVASYSTRVRPGATVATPLRWEELEADVNPKEFNTRTVPDRLKAIKRDPWQGFFELRQSLSKDMLAKVEKW
jgi:bifunctional non-homologous end joining protein LigD